MQKKINFSGNQWFAIEEIPTMWYKGIRYFDFKKIDFLTNNGLAGLINLLKLHLEKGIEVQLVNMNEALKRKIKSLGLDRLIILK